MPTNYQTLITEVKKTKQDNIKMAPMFKGTPGKEPDQMSLLELLGAAYAILREQDVSGDGNSAMKQWLSGVQVALDTIDSLSPAFPPESVFSAALAAGGDKAMKKLMGDKASLQALGELEERDRKIMSFFAVKVMGATLDLGVNKYVEGVMTADARMEAEARKKWDRFVEDSAYAETEQRKAKEDKATREKYDLLMEENARKEMEMEAEARKKWDRFVEDSAYAETERRKAEEEKKARERQEKQEREREQERKRAEQEAKLREERARQEAEDKATREKYDLLMEENARKEMEMEAEARKKWERFAEDSAYREAEQNAREKEKWDRFAEDSAYAETAANEKAEAEKWERFAEQSAQAENAARAAYERNERADMERQAAALLREENLSASPDNMKLRATLLQKEALLRKENPPACPDKQEIIQESVQGDPGQRRYYDDALKAALQRAGLTEQELRTNNDTRIHRSRSTEFYNVVHCAALARDTFRDDDVTTLGGHMKDMVNYCIRYLKKYPKVRSTQSGRDSYELALNLLALSANPGDPKVRECIDTVNAARGAKPGTKNFIDLGDYGPDRLLGRKVPAGEYIKDLDKRIAEQLKRSKDKSLTPNDMLKAKYEANRLKVEKHYLKTAVTPSKAVYPDRIAEKTKELWSDKRLMDKLVAHQSEKEQAQIMREHLARETASEPQPKTAQNEKRQNGPVAGA